MKITKSQLRKIIKEEMTREVVLDAMYNMLGTDVGRYMDALKHFVMRAKQEDLDEFMTGTGRAGYPGA
jgi:hypothetical protein